jgi:two-component system sensor histidine kinase PilS (NtrC family)
MGAMEPDSRKEEELRGKVKWLMLARLFVVTLLLGLSFLLHPDHLRNSDFLIASTYLVIAVYAVFFPRIRRLSRFASVQLAVDLVFETLLVGVTGGIESPFTFLYLISIVSWAIFHQRLGAILSAGISALLLGLLINLQYSGVLFFLPPAPLVPGEFFYTFLINILGLFAVGFLSGWLAQKLKEKEIGFASLRVFHEDIVKSISSGLLTTDLEGHISSFNRAAGEIIGFVPDEALGKVWWELFDWGKIREHFNLLLSDGVPQRFDGETKNRRGERLILGVTISPLLDGSGRQVGIIGIFQDLTQYKRLEEEMARREKLATIGEMAAGIAHEIRNPLAALSGSIQALRQEVGELSPENGRLLEIAIDEAERLNSIISQFLNYARPMPLSRVWCDLSMLLQDTLRLAEHCTDYRENIQIRTDWVDPIHQWVDPDQMKQVFWNLIINAFQSMPDGGSILISMKKIVRQRKEKDMRRGDAVEICFEDTGEGISSEHLSKIFSPFFTTKSQGSGLGLAIVQRIVESHGGRVGVRSHSRGTVFTIYIPSNEQSVAAEADTVGLRRSA